MSYAIGIDIGGTKIACGLVEDGKVLVRSVLPSDPSAEPKELCSLLAGEVFSLLERAGVEPYSVAGAGMLIPGHMNFDEGMVITCSNLPLWKNIRVQNLMQDLLRMPVMVDNDANGAAIGEFMYGAGKGERHMLYLTVSTGVGGGIIINRQVFRGTYGSAGEFGHNIIDKYSVIACGCGNHGCAEALASGTGMVKRARLMIKNGLVSTLQEPITALSIGKAARLGDPVAKTVLKGAIDDMGLLISNLYQTFNIRTVVMGGGVTKLGDEYIRRVADRAKAYTPMMEQYPIQLIPARLGDDTGMIGAAALVLSEGLE